MYPSYEDGNDPSIEHEILRKVAVVILISIVSKLTGLVREQSLAYCYGTSSLSDIYLVSVTIATAISGFITPAINSAYIPYANQIESTEGSVEMIEYTRSLFCWLTIVAASIIVVGELFSGNIVKLFANGFTTEQAEICSWFVGITVIATLPLLLNSVVSGYLQNHKRAELVSTVPIIENIIVVFFVILSLAQNTPILMAIGFTAGAVVAFIPLIIGAQRSKLDIFGNISLKSSHLARTLKRMFPIIIGASATQINVLVDRALASSMREGSISALYYADRLVGIIIGIVVLAPLTIIFPKMSKILIKKGEDCFYLLVKELYTLITAICILGMACLFFYNGTIVRLVYARGAFREESVNYTGIVLFIYSIGMLGYALRECMTRVYYAEDNYKTPFYNTILTVAINIVLDIVLGKKYGAVGLAVATASSAYLSILVMGIMRRHRETKMISKKNIVLTVLSILPSIVLWQVCSCIHGTTNAGVALIEMSMGMLLGLFLIVRLKPCDMKTITGMMNEE